MSDAAFDPLPIYFCMDRQEWTELHQLLETLPANQPPAIVIGRVLDRIQERTQERFGMVVWSFGDLAGVVAHLRERTDFEHGDEATIEQSGLTRDQIDDIAWTAQRRIEDAMTPAGWEALEYVVSDWLDEHGIERGRSSLFDD